jgi:hypothetical protein
LSVLKAAIQKYERERRQALLDTTRGDESSP